MYLILARLLKYLGMKDYALCNVLSDDLEIEWGRVLKCGKL
jgi:hypothetical protein